MQWRCTHSSVVEQRRGLFPLGEIQVYVQEPMSYNLTGEPYFRG